jgi:tungstate transport system substrate-binding protein
MRGIPKKIVVMIAVMVFLAMTTNSLMAADRLKAATTTSIENTGLLYKLTEPFETMFNVKVDVIAVGTGKALRLGSRGDVDLVIVHFPAKEYEFIASGYGVNRRDIMHNYFTIVGPENDPAQVSSAKTAVEAFRKIASAKSTFISRGDESGTHMKELQIWKASGIKPNWNGYIEGGQGMGAVLTIANNKLAYTLTDIGTFTGYKTKLDLKELFSKDDILYNPYGIIAINPAKFPHVNYIKAMAFIGFVTSPAGQKIIREFRVDGQQLFWPDVIP